MLVTFTIVFNKLLTSDNEINVKDKIIYYKSFSLFTKKPNTYFCYYVNNCSKRNGIFKLEVENSFSNYFDKETEIYKGMKKLMMIWWYTLNIIINFPVKLKMKSDDEFDEWKTIMTLRMIKLNIGLPR